MAAEAVKAADAAEAENKVDPVSAEDVGKQLASIMSAPVKIIGISGSLRKASANTGLLRVVEGAAKAIEGIEFEIVRYDDLPMFNVDLEGADASKDPKSVQEFRAKIRAADAILFATTEYNYGISSPLKNAIDWASRRGNAFKGKWYGLCVLLAVSVFPIQCRHKSKCDTVPPWWGRAAAGRPSNRNIS